MGAAVALRVDWFRVIADLRRCGYSAQSVADVVGVARATILYWGQGGEPKYTDGERLVAFWSQATELDRSMLPMTEPGMSAYRAAK